MREARDGEGQVVRAADIGVVEFHVPLRCQYCAVEVHPRVGHRRAGQWVRPTFYCRDGHISGCRFDLASALTVLVRRRVVVSDGEHFRLQFPADLGAAVAEEDDRAGEESERRRQLVVRSSKPALVEAIRNAAHVASLMADFVDDPGLRRRFRVRVTGQPAELSWDEFCFPEGRTTRLIRRTRRDERVLAAVVFEVARIARSANGESWAACGSVPAVGLPVRVRSRSYRDVKNLKGSLVVVLGWWRLFPKGDGPKEVQLWSPMPWQVCRLDDLPELGG